MKLRKSVAFLVLACICIASCKKEDAQKTTSSGAGGVLLSELHIFDTTFPYPQPDTISFSENAYAWFFDSTSGSFNYVQVDSVSVNGEQLELNDDTASMVYLGGYYQNMNTNCNWNVAGSSVIPSFTYNYTTPYPSFSGVLPDSMDKTAGVTFNLQLNATDSVIIQIWGDNTSSNGMVTKTFPPNQTSFSFSPAEVENISTSDFYNANNTIVITTFNHTVQTFSGNTFYFCKTSEYAGGIWVY